ncbi:SH3 domain-containing protein [Flectobacillus longus]|uniref:SH3 domain-containing protein n=1 Tax=Flectobacillus longus TaxID=2984207 RepID=UPI0024B63736|nr:SH3 domain-containing protein [Flectobacillus longus]MDI9881112.1 SH3 domain-containing protein [Flectobacillus longus]
MKFLIRFINKAKIVLALTFSVVTVSKAQSIEIKYIPLHITYEGDSISKKAENFTIINYTLINPLIARQVYDRSEKEFAKINSTISHSRNKCQSMIEAYVSKKTDSTYSGIFYNTNSNKKEKNIRITPNLYKTQFGNNFIFHRCVCVPSSLFVLDKDYQEILSEFNLPGGYTLEKNEIISNFFLNKVNNLNLKDSLSTDKILKARILKDKVYFYSRPNLITNIYIIKGDEVEVLEEKGEWLKIRYYGKKNIEGWIKRSDVD